MTDDAPVTSATSKLDFDPVPALAFALSVPAHSVAAVVAMLDEGNTVPFIARYRKERTGGLDEVQIRAIEYRRSYLVELEQRRAAIIESVTASGHLTPELEQRLRAATAKSELEDLYAPYRPRRKTRASIARDRGLQPLADKIASQSGEGEPLADAAAFRNEHVASAEDALAGARDIVAEQIADTAAVRSLIRRELADHGELISEVMPGKDAEPTKFEQYYRHRELVKQIPSHRYLAIRRGEAEGVLRAHVEIDVTRSTEIEASVLRLANLAPESPWASQLQLAVRDALRRLLLPSIENDVRAELKVRSDIAAVDVFAGNLRNLLLAAPLGAAAVVGVDPGLRTGCKCAAIDATGTFLGATTVHVVQGDAAKAKAEFAAFVALHAPRAIAIGNGTGSREAQAFVKRALAGTEHKPHIVLVNEAGASVYSASDLAREEFPELDLTIRGAISIARRLQDPLAELVKIEPRSIGVGQYQHDVQEVLLGKRLGDVVETCVNHVGVELNTASAQLLGYVAGIGPSVAKNIVGHREASGSFQARSQLLDVAGIGPKTFEQAAGFLKISAAANPLDGSAVHPERYPIVEKMATDLGVAVSDLIGNADLVDKIDLARYATGDVGEPTLRDIATELKKPGRDPRAEFNPPKFRDDVTAMEDLSPGMVLEGVVTNVTAFGAFVDIGVHNDGLVHVSQLSEQFVKNPSEVVKVGDKLKVRVLEIDHKRKRIALTVRPPGQQQDRPQQQNRAPRDRGGRPQGPGGGPQGRRNAEPRAEQAHPGHGGHSDAQGGHGEPRGGEPRRDRNAPNDRRSGKDAQNPQGSAPRGSNDRNDSRIARDAPGQGRRNDRRNDGPRNDGPRNDGPRNDGPRNDGPRNDGPRGPRRDQRGDDRRADERRPDDRRPDQRDTPPENWGVSGFVNNPFAALGKTDERKR